MVTLRRMIPALIVAVSMTAVSGCGGTGSESPAQSDATGEVLIAAASDLRYALDDVLDRVEQRHPDLRPRVTYGSSGQFLQQIESGAPFDLYLSADLSYPQSLVDSGRAPVDELFTYAIGRLVLWVPEGSEIPVEQGLDVLLDPAITTIAIANPDHAPYGRAAVQALASAGIESAVQDRFVIGENIAQAAEFVASGNADAGIVALSLVLADPLKNVGSWSHIPNDMFPTMEQGGVVLTDSKGARTVRDMLLDDEGQAILSRYGFLR